MTYAAAPILPLSVCGPVRCWADGVCCCEHPASRAMRTTSDFRRMRLDVGAPLTTIDCNTRAGDKACLPRAQKRDDARHLLSGAEAAERHLVADEVGDPLGVGELTP